MINPIRRPQINIVAFRNITYRMVYGILQHMALWYMVHNIWQHMAAGFYSATI